MLMASGEIISILAHVIGVVGMACVVTAFHMTVAGHWAGTSKRFNWVNLTGGTLLLISLFVHFNLGSFIIELFWIVISLNGLRKVYCEPS